MSCPARAGSPATGWAPLRSCEDVEANPGQPPPNMGEEYNAVLPDMVVEACARLGIAAPVRDAFATPTSHRFPAFWSKADDAFAQAWDYVSAGALWANSRPVEVVTQAAKEGCYMLIVAPGWDGPNYPWCPAPFALCPKRWCFDEGRPVHLRGGTYLMPTCKWRTWAFQHDSRSFEQARPMAPPGSTGPEGVPH